MKGTTMPVAAPLATCKYCQREFENPRGQVYCCRECKLAGYRAGLNKAVPLPTPDEIEERKRKLWLQRDWDYWAERLADYCRPYDVDLIRDDLDLTDEEAVKIVALLSAPRPEI